MTRAWLVGLVAACSSGGRPAATAGSGSGSGSAGGSATVAIVVDAAPPDAAPLATEVQRACAIAGAGVHCVLTPRNGVLRGERCWQAVVAIEDHAAAKLRTVTSRPACTGDVAWKADAPLDLAFAAGAHLDKACAADDACEVIAFAAEEVARELPGWTAKLQAQLKDEKAEREQAARDREPADGSAFDAIYEHYMTIEIEEAVNAHTSSAKDAEMSVRAAGPMILMGVVPDDRPLTKGQVRCALEAGAASSFRECFHVEPPADDGSAGSAAATDAAVPSDGP